MTTTTTRRWGAVLAPLMVLGLLGATACAPPPPPPPPTCSSATPVLEVDRDLSSLDPAGEVVTITGRGFTTTGNLGTRPPLLGQPGGVYVTFGRFADVWKPSAGAPSSARQIAVQKWALPEPSYSTLNPLGTNPDVVLMDGEGCFTAQILVSPVAGTNPNLGIAVYPGSGAVNAAEEFFLPVGFS